jgi:type IV pilus assembly protein PilE
MRMRETGRGRKTGGFTLIELMIAVAIVGILVAVALPQYTGHLRKSRRAEMQAYMMDIAQRQKQYFIDNRGYAATTTTLNGPTLPSDLTNYYTVTVATGTGTFTITATSQGKQVLDGDLTVNEAGTKAPSDKW